MNFYNAYQKCVGRYIDAIFKCILMIIIIETVYKNLKKRQKEFFK